MTDIDDYMTVYGFKSKSTTLHYWKGK